MHKKRSKGFVHVVILISNRPNIVRHNLIKKVHETNVYIKK